MLSLARRCNGKVAAVVGKGQGTVVADFRELIDRIRAQTPTEVVIAAPPTEAEWERFSLLYEGLDVPAEVFSLYSVGNGSDDLLGGADHCYRWLPLPTKPQHVFVSWPAPCRAIAQLPILGIANSGVTLLLEGPHLGEVWSANTHSTVPHFGARVASSLKQLFEDGAVVAENEETILEIRELPGVDGWQAAWKAAFPGISAAFWFGRDERPVVDLRADGGLPDVYSEEGSATWMNGMQQLQERFEQWDRERFEWWDRAPGRIKRLPPKR